MNIKHMLIVVAIITLTVTTSYATKRNFASGGVINFSGAITDTTCTINDGKSEELTIELNPITIQDAGTEAGVLITKHKKALALTFSNCSSSSSGDIARVPLKIYFSSVNNISNDGKYLKNTTVNEDDPSISRNVGFAITKKSETVPLLLNQPLMTNIDDFSRTQKLELNIYYYKTNTLPARPGRLKSSVTYTISYL